MKWSLGFLIIFDGEYWGLGHSGTVDAPNEVFALGFRRARNSPRAMASGTVNEYCPARGSGLVNESEKITVAAIQMAATPWLGWGGAASQT